MSKIKRQQKLLDIIKQYEVETQEEYEFIERVLNSLEEK